MAVIKQIDLGDGWYERHYAFSNGHTAVGTIYDNLLRSKNDRPSYVTYNHDGLILSERWHLNADWHRENGPATRYYDYDHDTVCPILTITERWLRHGQLHCLSGPAIRVYIVMPDGEPRRCREKEYYYIDGCKVSKDMLAKLQAEEDYRMGTLRPESELQITF